MLLDQRNEIRGRVPSQCRLGKMRISGEKILGPAVNVGKVAAPPSRDEDLFPQSVRMIEDGNPSSALSRLNRAHQSGRATAENQRIEGMRHVCHM
jgi:hypothetical protein